MREVLGCSESTYAYGYFHLVVFLYGFTCILGKLISYGALVLVWHRMAIASILYLCIPSVWTEIFRLSWRSRFTFLGIGVVVCCHWFTLYWSIKLGDSASITLACMGAGTLFTAILEPWLCGERFSPKDILAGIIVIFAVLQIYYSLPESSPDPSIHYGLAVAVGLVSAMLASLFDVLNKIHIEESTPLCIAALEMVAGTVLLTAITPIVYGEDTLWFPHFDISNLTIASMRSGPWDLIWVLILSVLCTNLAFYLQNEALHHLSAFTVNLLLNLEPVYGIVLGALLFHENEQLNFHFYIGTFIILGTVFCSSLVPDFEVPCYEPQQTALAAMRMKLETELTQQPKKEGRNLDSSEYSALQQDNRL